MFQHDDRLAQWWPVQRKQKNTWESLRKCEITAIFIHKILCLRLTELNSGIARHITDNYQHAQATSPMATSLHVYCTKIVTELLSQYWLFTRMLLGLSLLWQLCVLPPLILKKWMNEWMHEWNKGCGTPFLISQLMNKERKSSGWFSRVGIDNALSSLQCFDAVGWAAGRASSL